MFYPATLSPGRQRTSFLYKFAVLVSTLIFTIITHTWAQVVEEHNSSTTFTVPAGVTSVKVEAWGGGGGGGGSQNNFFTNRFGGGGGGGGYSVANISVTGGENYTLTIGAGGTVGSNANGGPGGNTLFSGPGGMLSAGGGAGGAKSTAATGGAGGTGNTYNGGNGGTGTSNGAGGGGGAGNNGNGNNGSNTAAGTGGPGSPNVSPYVGGAGGAARTNATNPGFQGTAPGGGGGGGKSNTATSAGGAGAAGRIVLTYYLPPTISGFSPLAICPGSNVTITGTEFAGISAANILINGTPVSAIVSNSGTQLVVTPAPGNTTGNISITNTGGTVISGTALTINENSTLSLSSGNPNQTFCLNGGSFTDIEYTIGGGATGANVTGLPAGISYNLVGNLLTISGTAVAEGAYPFTVTTTGPCNNPGLGGTITINGDGTGTLSSAPGTDAQSVCQGSSIADITYSIPALGITSVTVSGLPAGVNYNFTGGILTISGTPAAFGVFNYTVNITGPCTNNSPAGSITANEASSINVTSGSAAQTICINTAIASTDFTRGGSSTGWTLTGTLPPGVSGTDNGNVYTISGAPTSAGAYAYTLTADGPCPVSTNGSIDVDDNSTLSLTSAGATTSQSVCVNTAIADITYAVGGGGTGATVSGLPAGVSYNFAAGVLTISGTPTGAGSFSYTVTTTGPCINPSLGGTIDVTADATITLTSGAGSDNQTFCINNALPVNITYAVGGSGTGISIQSGTLPLGMASFFSEGVFTITGFGLEAGTFNLVLTSEGPCVTPTANVTIVVQDNSTINLSSGTGTEAQTVCINTAITPISYAISGGGTGANVTGLPAGVTGSFNAGVFTISGTPTESGSFSYTVTTTGPCVNVQSGGTIDVTGNGTISLTSAPATANQFVCDGSAITDIVYSIGGSATSASITAGSLPAGLSANYNAGMFTISGTPTSPGTYNFTVTATGPCVEPELSGSIIVSALPTLGVSPVSATICVGDNTALTASSNINYPPVLINELFNVAGSGTFTATGTNSGGGTAFQNFTSPNLAGLTTITNNNGTRFMMASASAFGSASTNSQLTSPSINTVGYSALSLTFRHSYQKRSEAGVSVQVSTDPGNAVWQNINTAGNVIATNTYTATQGANNNFVSASFNLNNYLNQPNLRIRFNYTGNVTFNTGWWAIDDVNISGTPLLPLYSWSADTGPSENGLPPNAGTFLTANSSISVDPTQTTTYTLSVKHPVTGCENSGAQSLVTVNQNGTIDQSSAIGTEAQTVCINTAIADIIYTIGGAATGAQITAGSLPSGLTGTYSGGAFTISGTPTEAGTFPYTVSTTGSLCINPSMGGSITVTPDATISLSSASGTDAQTVCINTAITNITYAIGGSGDDASITSGTLPSGVTGSYNGGVYTISGTPSEAGSFAYTITATGPCASAQISGTIEVTADGTISLSSAEGTDAQSICINTALTDISYTIGATASGATISAGALPNGVIGTFTAGVFTISGTPTESGSFSYTVSATGSACVNPSLSGTIEVIAEAVVGSVSGPTAVCEHVAPTGVAAVYSCTSSDPASVFNWSLPLGASNITGQGTNTISFVYPSGFTSGTIAVDVSSTCGAIENRTLDVGATTPDLPGVVSGITNVCPYIGLPDQLTYSIAPVAGALSYEWIVPPSCTLVSGQGSNSILITVGSNFQSLANKVIRVRVMSGCGNSLYQLKYLQAQFPMTPGPITGTNDVCEVINTPTEVTYSINKVLAATSYVWTVPAGATATHPNGPGINDTIIKVVFDNSFVTSHISVISVNNCLTSGSSRSLLVYRNNPPTPGLITGPTNACEYSVPSATPAYYTIRKVPVATSYTWTVPAGATITHENAPGANDTAIYVTFPNGYSSGSITVKSHNGCGTSGIRSLSVARLNVGMPSAIDIQTGTPCPVRQFVYSIASMPYNATLLVWTVPAGGTIDLGQGTTSIQVSYSSGAIAGNVTVQAFNNCSQSLVRTAAIKLPACPPEPKAPVKPEFSISNESEVMDVSVFPNPSTSHFNVRYNSKEPAKLRVMDALGKVLYEHSVRPGELLQMGDKLKAGTYFIEVQQGNRRKTFRAIKL